MEDDEEEEEEEEEEGEKDGRCETEVLKETGTRGRFRESPRKSSIVL